MLSPGSGKAGGGVDPGKTFSGLAPAPCPPPRPGVNIPPSGVAPPPPSPLELELDEEDEVSAPPSGLQYLPLAS